MLLLLINFRTNESVTRAGAVPANQECVLSFYVGEDEKQLGVLPR